MAAYQEILAHICKVLEPYAKQDYTISETTELVMELGLSSLQVMEMIERLEDDYDISIPLNILLEVRSVGDLVRQLERLMNPRP